MEIVETRSELKDQLPGRVILGPLECCAEVLERQIVAAVDGVCGGELWKGIGELPGGEAFLFPVERTRITGHG